MKRYFVLFVLLFFQSAAALAWSEHPLLVYYSIKDMPQFKNMEQVKAETLHDFLMSVEKELEIYLNEQENWSRTNLKWYSPRPDELAFIATGNRNDVLTRFFNAIRINPNARVPLYLYMLPDQDITGMKKAPYQSLTTLKDNYSMEGIPYVWISEGASVSPLQVLITAADEPDYGFDLGLYEDNNTTYGKTYGFGKQPFGNPNLEYGSQAPFHMGFYHESPILYKFGAFLRDTHLDYRHLLYKSLAEFAFKQNKPYWGYRFMGWSIHYLGDATMPYHITPLPGVSTGKMIWINLKAMLGSPKAKDDAVQLVSNRHTVFENYQQLVMKKAVTDKNFTHPMLSALANPKPAVKYNEDFIRSVAAKAGMDNAKRVDRAVATYFPERMVSDPAVEANDLTEMKDLDSVVRREKGTEAAGKMEQVMADQLGFFSMSMRSFVNYMLD